MSCTEIRERLLEAELDELAGESDTAVGRHVRSCPACGAVARTLLAETRALGAALDSLAPSRDAVAPAARVAGSRPSIAADPVPSVARERGGSPVSRSRGRVRRWAPLAAAAGLAGLIAIGRGENRPLGDPSTPLDRPEAAAGERFAIEVPDDGRLAVFDTADPSIKVVWFY